MKLSRKIRRHAPGPYSPTRKASSSSGVHDTRKECKSKN
jgi:hypothetical protein